MKSFLFAALFASNVDAQAVLANCGSSGDHLSGVTIKTTSVGTEPVTVDVSGVLDEDITEGFLDLDFHIKALGVINLPVKSRIHFTYTPGVVKGPLRLKIGPVTTPWLPGTNLVTGTLKVSDANTQPVLCASLNVPLMAAPKSTDVVAADPVVSCSSANAHVKNFHYINDKQTETLTLTGDLDEDLSSLSLNLDARVSVGWFPIPISVSVPIVYEPGFVTGPFKIVATNTTNSLGSQLAASEGSTDLVGTVKCNDRKSEEVFCLKVDIPLITGEDSSVVV